MPIVNRIAEFAEEMKAWRRYLHQNPELGFDCHNTASFVVDRLKEFGIVDIHEGIAQSGVVALIHGSATGPVIGLRADMDALPIEEATGADYASKVPGKCTPVGMTVTPPCYWAPLVTWQRPVIFQEQSL